MGPRLFGVDPPTTPVGDDGAVRLRAPPLLTSLHGYQRAWLSADVAGGTTLLVIAVPEQLATSRLAGMPPITGFYAFVAGTVLFALLGSNPQMSVGADSTIAPLFAAGVSALALSGSPHYVDLVEILAVIVGLIVMLVSLLRLGWIADFLSAPIVRGFLSGVAVIIVIHQLPDLLGLPPAVGERRAPHRLDRHAPRRHQRLDARHRPGCPRHHVRERARQSAHPGCADRHGRRHGGGRRVRLAVPRRGRPRPHRHRRAPRRPHRRVVVDAAEAWRRSPRWWRSWW